MTDPEGLAPAGGGGGQEPPNHVGATPVYVVVRSTVHLRAFPRGEERIVDATDPDIQDCLEAGLIVPVGEPDELPWGS